jgi:hypothetical protein
MGIKLLPALTNPPDLSGTPDMSTGLVPAARSPLATQVGKGNDIGRPGDTYAWSSSATVGRTNRIYGTPVEDSDTQRASDGEYVSALGSSPPIARAAVAHYLMFARFPVGNGRLLDVYA